MKKIIILIYLFPIIVFTQNNTTITFSDSITIEADTFIEKDIYNNYYFIKNNVLVKSQNNQKLEYQNLGFGKLYSVDTSNPLLLVLFYKDFNTIVLLDQQLNETQTIYGNDFDFVFEIVGLARQNNLWFFDAITQKFGLYNFKDRTSKFISTYFPTDFISWKTSYNNFAWIDHKNKVFTIDFFGKIQETTTLEPFQNITFITSDSFLVSKENKIYFKCFETVIPINIKQKSFKNFCFKDGILSIFTNNKVFNYKINLP